MSGILTKLGLRGKAGGTDFTPRSNIPRSDVQGAVEYVMDNAENVGTVYAPTDAQYLTNGAVAGLSNERAVTDTATITWDFGTLGQAKANWAHLGIEDLTDPGGDRGMFWDDSAGNVAWFTAGTGMGFSGTNLSITDADLVAIVDATFVAGDILYHNGTTLARLAAGTDGQFLRTRGTATAPDWQNISGGGDMLRANNLSDLASALTARANLGLTIGTHVQAWDADLDTFSGLAKTDGNFIVADGAAWTVESGATARASLGLTIGTHVQAQDATLQSLAALGTTADRIAYTTALDTWAETPLTSFARSILDDADEATFKATVNLEPGVDVQAYDAELAAIAGLVSAADKVPYFTGSGTAALADFTAYGRSVVAVANEAAFKALVNLEIGTDVQAYSSVLANTTASFTTAQETKLGHITITQAVDLDAIETRVNALDAAVVLKGTWDASAGTFPGSGTAQAGDSYIVSVSGTVDGVAFVAGDRIIAITDNASTTTYASNWFIADYTDKVSSVAGRTGAVTIASTDITDSTANGRAILTAANYAAMKALLDLEIGTDVQAYDAELAAIAGLVSAADSAPYFTGSGTAALATLTAFGRSIIDDADEATFKATVNLEIGVDVQAYDELLNEIAALSTDPNADSGLFFDDSAGNIAYWTPANGLEFSGANLQQTTNARTRTLTFIIDGGGSTITTGIKGDLEIPFACTINQVTMGADQSGSIVVDVWKDTYANFPPTDADSITASAVPTISTATKSQDSTLTGWTTSISAGDILRFNVDSVTSITRVTLSLKVTMT